MPQRGKKYTDSARRFDRQRLHGPSEALDLVKSLGYAKFDETVGEFKGGRVEYRADTRSRGVVQVPIGKTSFTRDQLLDNFRAVIDELQRAKPAAAKGKYIKSIAISSTMGPGVKVDTNRLRL